MAVSLHTTLALTITLCVTLQEGLGLPVSGQDEVHDSPRHVRAKRCSCSNWLDKECIYFCHLDIIWVNTPSKTTPYGLGSPLSRRRRATGRCGCANLADRTCTAFCQNSAENPALLLVDPNDQDLSVRPSARLLTSFRQVIQANMQAVGRDPGPRKRISGALRLKRR